MERLAENCRALSSLIHKYSSLRSKRSCYSFFRGFCLMYYSEKHVRMRETVKKEPSLFFGATNAKKQSCQSWLWFGKVGGVNKKRPIKSEWNLFWENSMRLKLLPALQVKRVAKQIFVHAGLVNNPMQNQAKNKHEQKWKIIMWFFFIPPSCYENICMWKAVSWVSEDYRPMAIRVRFCNAVGWMRVQS